MEEVTITPDIVIDALSKSIFKMVVNDQSCEFMTVIHSERDAVRIANKLRSFGLVVCRVDANEIRNEFKHLVVTPYILSVRVKN